jgi:O-antigen ligase
LLSKNLQRIHLTHISLASVGLMWVFPFLYYRHQYPLTTFDQEWWSALLGVLALTLLIIPDYWRNPQIPRIVQLPAALIVLVLLQWAVGLMVYFDQALLYLLYLLLALLLMMLGGRLRDCVGLEKLAVSLAIFLLIGAESSALVGVLQHYRWHTLLDSVVVIARASVYGNLAQPNHFADYIALGLISLGLLFQQRKLPVIYVALLAAPLLFVMTLSGSRSSWLYLVMMSVLAWWGGRRLPELRPLLRYCLLLLAGFAVMHGIVQLPFMKGAGSNFDVMHRMFGDTSSVGIRLYLWHEAWLIFRQSPWLGAGFGQFAWQHFQMGPMLRQANISGLYNNAHNLIFQLAAEAGIAGLTVLFAALTVWLNGIRRATMSAAHWWGYAILGVLGIHSLLEYPLWYSYFLAIAAILLGALDETRYRLRNAGRVSVTVMLLLGLLSLLQLRVDYQQIKDILASHPASSAAFDRSRGGLAALHNRSLLSPYADLFTSSYTLVNEDHLQEKLSFNYNVMRFMPIASVVYRQAYLLAQSGQIEQARRVFEQALWSYPVNVEEQQQLVKLAEKDPAHFAALLEFALQKEQEYVRAIHNK